ncbi:MAG: hypothetical protein JO322_11485 [Candidatus Eremiobacteraeota bacterium]|nr:hypothetical protein [Candidatus Eremiobacteraeota bacterium]
MEANEQHIAGALLPVLDIPKDGRVLTFGAGSALVALGIAAARPDVLIVVCDTTSEVTRSVSDRALAENLNNIIAGDTPAGPLVDRALCYDSFGTLQDVDLVTLRNAMLPGGYAIFAETTISANDIADRLRKFGYQVADALDSLPAHNVVRAR